MYWLGIDGGGTKTEYILSDEKGNILARKRTGTISYKQIGKENCICMIKSAMEELVESILPDRSTELYTCCALPNYGESREADGFLKERIETILADYHMYLVNDCQVGWAGSLGLEAGINLVAGTGAIAYGQDEEQNSVRAGGWNDEFSDEGSCAWLGKKTMEVFSKESDGRAEPGPLLQIVREKFSLTEDMDIVDIYEAQYQNDRTRKADLQRLLLKAAEQGDRNAVKIYEEAARELSLTVLAVFRKLKFRTVAEVQVSYSGGLFHAGRYILDPLRRELSSYPIQLTEPLFTPAYGAVLLSASHWGDAELTERLKAKWLSRPK